MELEPVVPSSGLGVIHLFCKVSEAGVDSASALSSVKSMVEDGYQVLSAALLGHKADVCFMAIGSDLWRLRLFQTELAQSGLRAHSSYVSLTEVSEYAAGMPEERLNQRLYPKLPPQGKSAFCFYPMSKRRVPGQNWYELSYEDRERLMYDHGSTGRRFAGKVVQLVTGSAGLDDFEWGVTLFAEHIDDLKAVVYTMRFDEVSARYAEFGPFFAGMLADAHDVLMAVGAA